MKKRVALISSDDLFAKNVAGTLARLGFEMQHASNAEEARTLLHHAAFDSLLFDESMDPGNDLGLLEKAASLPTSILCTDGDEFATIRLLEIYDNVMHVFGKNKPYYDVELTTALRKIIDGKMGGIEDYLDPRSKITRLDVVDYGLRNAYLDQVHAFADSLKCFPDFADMVSTVTWELLMNAMFDAPVDRKTGKKKYAHLSRNQNLRMADDERVQLAFGSDEHSFAVSVRDTFGALTRDTVVSSLVRCSRAGADQIRDGDAGAGVGLYLLFNSISQINFDIQPGQSTEVIFVVFLSKRLRDFVLRARSVNFFVGA